MLYSTSRLRLASYSVVTLAEQKILNLSAKVIALQDTEGFYPAIRELRAAIHEHLQEMRGELVGLSVVIRNESDSKAAD